MNSQTPLLKWGGGGTLYTLKTCYKILGIQVFAKITPKIHHTSKSKFSLWASLELGEYVAKNPNASQKILNLVKDLSPINKAFVLRQIGRCVQCYETNNPLVSNLSQQEIDEWRKINTEFLPNIFKLGENLFCYDGYFLPIQNFEVSVFWHKHSLNILEKQTLTKMRQKDFIDVGGFVGDSAIIFEREFCDKNIYSFEATKANFNLMQETLRLNDSKRIIPINKGLGAKKSTIKINVYGSASSMIYKRCSDGDVESVELITLDEFIKEHKIEVGFIKVDIEGFEMEFLKGAKETICTQKPAMLLSIYHSGGDYFGIKPLIESWNLGYSFKIHRGEPSHLTSETALFCEVLE